MNINITRLLLIASFSSLHYLSQAREKTPYATWLLPGVGWRFSDRVRLLGQLGYNHYLHSAIAYPQAFITIHKNIVLNPAYIYLVRKEEGRPHLQEHYLMNAIILQARKKDFLIDDRNMLWDRFTVGTIARHYYRNRLRLTQSFKTWSATTRLYGYDEVFLLFNTGKLSRNRVALGINSDLTEHLYIDVTHIWQWDRDAGNLNLLFVTGTWQL